MDTKHLVPAQQFCTHYNIELSFIRSLQSFGLIDVVVVEETHFIHEAQIRDIEQMIRLHYDLEINLEGIDAISHLLRRVHDLQQELAALKNKLQESDSE